MCQCFSSLIIGINFGLLLFATTISFGLLVDSDPLTDICGQHERDPPTILVNDPWVHAGEKSTISLSCNICALEPHTVWWTKNGQKLSERSSRIRQIHNHYKKHEYRLKIRNVRQQDFGEYECNVYVNDTRLQRSATLNVTGVPYPAKFELPTTWSDTSYTLSWGVNCSINAPIINYQLSFKELPHGPWRSINIPAEMREVKNNAWYDNRYKRSKLVEFKQSYTIRGLTHGSRYKAKIKSRNEFGFSAETVLEAFQTGEDFSTFSTTNLFQRVEDLGGNKYYQDEQPTSSTIESPHLKKDVFNSEPLSTKEENKVVFAFTSNAGLRTGLRNLVLIFGTFMWRNL